MPHRPKTQIERMQRIETLVEEGFSNQKETQADLTKNLGELRDELAQMREQMLRDKTELKKTVDDDVADLARLKNRGTGIITGVLIAAGVAGVSFAEAIKSAWKAFIGG